MQIVNIHEAKTHLSRLIEKAAGGEPFIIAKAGRPMVKVIPIGTVQTQCQRLGFLADQFSIPEDFDRIGGHQIDTLFGGSD